MYNSQVSGSMNLLPLESLVINCKIRIPSNTTIKIIGNFFEEISTKNVL